MKKTNSIYVFNSIQCAKVFGISVVFVVLAACSYQSYNPAKPNEYNDYWCNPKNRQTSVFKEKDQGNKSPNAQQECLDSYKGRAQGGSY